MKKIFYLVFIFTLAAQIRAQWVQTNGPYGGPVGTLAVCGTGLFAGTDGGIFCSTNNGSDWTLVKSASSIYAPSCLAVSDSSVFAGIWGEGIFKSTDNGISWQEVNTGLTSLGVIGLTAGRNTTGEMYIFACIRQADTPGINIFLSTNNGANWTHWFFVAPTKFSELSFGPDIRSMAFIDSSLFLAEAWGGGLLKLSQKDKTFIEVDSVIKNNSIFCLAYNESNIFAGTYNGVMRSTDNGVTWTNSSAGLPANNCIYALGAKGEYLFAYSGNLDVSGTAGIYRSTDDGLSWTCVNSGLPVEIHVNTYVTSFAFSGTYAFASSWDGVFLSTDHGAAWTAVNNGIAETFIYNISVFPTKTFQQHLIITTGNKVFISNDDGRKWSELESFDKYAVFAFFPFINDKGETIILAGGTGTYFSTDYGTSWTSSGLTSTYVLTFTALGKKIFAGTGDQGVYASTDEGKTWNPANAGNTGGKIFSFAASGTSLFSCGSEGVFFSSDSGKSWTAVNNGLEKNEEYNDYFLRNLAVSGSNLFVGTMKGIYLSTDNGSSWNKVDSGLTNKDIGPLYFAPDDKSLFAASIEGGVYLSKDMGKSWKEISSGLPGNTYVTCFAAKGPDLYAGTNNSGIWRRSLSEMTAPVETSAGLPEKFSLEQNYPNPFNPTTTIKFSLPYSSHVRLKIFDILGSEVVRLLDEERPAGKYQVIWKADNCSSGIYFYEIMTSGFIQTRKMMLLR